MKDSRLGGPNDRLTPDDRVTPSVERRPMIEADDRPVSQVLQDILANVQELVRSEVRLARTEISEQISTAARAAVFLVTGGVLAAYAVGFLLWSAVYALGQVTPAWLAPLLVALVVAAAASVFIVIGRNRIKLVNPKPEKTIASLKEDVQWVKDQTK
jgi:uncharacterized membrane protein YqjE